MKPQRPSDKEILQAYLNLQIQKIITVPCSITDTWHKLVAEAAHRGDVDLLATTHEGNLAGIAAGVYFATGHPALVHFQNSGLCNAGDGFVSFAHPRMFAIPMAVLITERGIAADDDSEPHQEIGRRTKELVATLFGSESTITEGSTGEAMLPAVTQTVEAARSGGLGVMTLAPDAFRRSVPLCLPSFVKRISADRLTVLRQTKGSSSKLPTLSFSTAIKRDVALSAIFAAHPGAALLFCNGFTSRAAQAIQDRDGNFYNVGYMGGTMAIGWSLARYCPGLEVVVVDGDQNALMSGMKDHLLAEYPANLHWYILNNHIGASVGIAESLPLSPLYEILANVIETLPDPPGTFCYPRVKAPGSGKKNLATLTRRFRTWIATQSTILQLDSFSTNHSSNHHDI